MEHLLVRRLTGRSLSPLADQFQRRNVNQLLDGSRTAYPHCTQLAVGLQELDQVVMHKFDLRLHIAPGSLGVAKTVRLSQ